MTDLLKTLPILVLSALALAALPAAGQTADSQGAETAPQEEAAPDPMALNLGETAASEPSLGDIYVAAEFNDWDLRCIVSEAELDPCQLYQLLVDGNDNPVAEINIFPLAKPGDAAAGATVITPLETLLTAQLTVSVDGGTGKRYPFGWCSQIGCFVRLGLTQDEVNAFKRGATATLTIVPVAAPDQKVNLNLSLAGFTAAFTAAADRIAQGAAASQN